MDLQDRAYHIQKEDSNLAVRPGGKMRIESEEPGEKSVKAWDQPKGQDDVEPHAGGLELANPPDLWLRSVFGTRANRWR